MVNDLEELDELIGRLRVQEDTPIREEESVPETAGGEIREVQKVRATEATAHKPLTRVGRGMLQPHTLTFFLDTGADVTVLPAWYWDRMQRPALRKSNIVLRTANDGRLNVLGQLRLTARLATLPRDIAISTKDKREGLARDRQPGACTCIVVEGRRGRS